MKYHWENTHDASKLRQAKNNKNNNNHGGGSNNNNNNESVSLSIAPDLVNFGGLYAIEE